MTSRPNFPRLRALVLASAAATLAGAAVAAVAAVAAGASAPAGGEARYQQERARCASGQSGQALETCLKEAGAARQQAGQGQLTEGDAQNERKRCEPLSGDEKRDCLARANGGPGTKTTGSVKGGGIVRETTTAIPTPVAPGSSAAR